MSSISGIYKITLIADNRIYIGSSADIKLRWQYHRNSSTQLIGKMIKKHGKSAFLFEIIEEVEPQREKLVEREQHYLDTLQPFPWNGNGFNLSPTAYSILGITRSTETKQRMRDSWHQNRGPEYYKQLSERVSGSKNPACRPEVRAKISKAMTGKKKSLEEREQMSISRTGRKYTEEAKQNMRIAQQKNNTRSDAAKEKFYLAQRVLYKITQPSGNTFEMYSRELKAFCKLNKLSYSNLITTAKTHIPFKDGWLAERLSKG